VAQESMFLVRRLEDGSMRTVMARGTTTRHAMRVFVAKYGPPVGETFAVKLRLGSDWDYYRTTSSGIRQVTP
jgi:hypothetical protein